MHIFMYFLPVPSRPSMTGKPAVDLMLGLYLPTSSLRPRPYPWLTWE